MAEKYEHLIGKAVLAVPADGVPTRGIYEVDDLGHRWVRAFHGYTASWTSWESLTELPFGDLTKDDLLDWHHYDPRGYLLAGHAWASEVRAKGGT